MIANKKILFITDSCPPNLTMSGIVVKNIIDSLSDSNECDIVAVMQGDNDIPEYNNIRVNYVKSFPYHILNNRRKMLNSSGLARAWYKFVVLIFRMLSIFMRLVSSVGINGVTTSRLKKTVGACLARKKYDYVLCNAKPFESFEAVYRLLDKHKSTVFIAYQTDDFVTAGDERYIPKFLQDIKLKNRAKRLNEYVEAFDVYGMIESVYSKEITSVDSRDRVTKLGIPLLYDRSASGSSRAAESGTLNFVYAGSLVKSFRPADDCLNIMTEVAKSVDLTMDVYHRGDCYDVIDEYASRSGGVIRNKGEVSAEESYKAISNADMLISISNVDGDQISGKTFDYMSTCKPIIHFYYKEDDMNASVFDRYTYGLSVRVTGVDMQQNIKRIVEFIENTKDANVTYGDVEKEFKMYTVAEVVDSLFAEGKK